MNELNDCNGPRVVVSASVRPCIADALDARAEAEGRSRSDVMRTLLVAALRNVSVGVDGARRWAA